MSIRYALARAAGTISTGILKHILHRAGENFPGKIGLYIDPELIADLAPRLREGSIVVVGTNGKTTVTNLLADAFERAGKSVACNRTGANLDSGVATALLHARGADWGVLESDELWLAHITPRLRPHYVLLLNLFRDQLDRMGEIEHIQESIAQALCSSPDTTLVYNCDDPLCQAIADRVNNESIAFGIGEDLGLPQNAVADSGLCQQCSGMLDYAWRQYGQLGAYRCPKCGFARAEPTYRARNIALGASGTSFTAFSSAGKLPIYSGQPGTYMVYNLLAVYAAASCCKVSPSAITAAIDAFAPDNGRLQRYEISGRHILLNLAKNPTGFNQNLRIILADPAPKAVAFFINDKEADGHDVSWLWDVDFQELAACDNLVVFAGGMRRNDMQVRLKYAGVNAPLVDGAVDFLEQAQAALPDANCYIIANYTALPQVKAELDGLRHFPQRTAIAPTARNRSSIQPVNRRLTIVHLYPELLNLYGDGGNVTVLANRARWRGIETDVVRIEHGQNVDLSQADIVFLGGGPDREQRLASDALLSLSGDLRAYVEDDGVLLAICGGYQILGHEWLLGDDTVPGLGILDITTKRAPGGSHNRLVGNVVLQSPLANAPIVGYENHAGRTFIGRECTPFGHVMDGHGFGNNDDDHADGVRYRNVVGTYLHGPLLSKNPEVADCLISAALQRRARKKGGVAPALPRLDDAAELAANTFMCVRLGIRTQAQTNRAR